MIEFEELMAVVATTVGTLVLVAFVYAWWSNPKITPTWHRLNILVFVNLVVVITNSALRIFFFGLSEEQCNQIASFSSAFGAFNIGCSVLFFSIRFMMVSRLYSSILTWSLIVISTALTIVSPILFFLVATAEINPESFDCEVELPLILTSSVGSLTIGIDCICAILFIRLLRSSVKAVRGENLRSSSSIPSAVKSKPQIASSCNNMQVASLTLLTKVTIICFFVSSFLMASFVLLHAPIFELPEQVSHGIFSISAVANVSATAVAPIIIVLKKNPCGCSSTSQTESDYIDSTL